MVNVSENWAALPGSSVCRAEDGHPSDSHSSIHRSEKQTFAMEKCEKQRCNRQAIKVCVD